MLQLLKREWLKNWPLILVLFITMTVIYSFQSSTVFNYIYFVLILIIMTSNREEEHQFLISLPVKKKHIVLSYYTFISTITICFIAYQFLLGEVIFQSHPELSLGTTLFTILISICSIFILLAISLPLYYYFKSKWGAFFVQLAITILLPILFIISLDSPFFWIMDKIVDFIFIEPFSISILGVCIVLYLSYFVSCRIFSNRDFA